MKRIAVLTTSLVLATGLAAPAHGGTPPDGPVAVVGALPAGVGVWNLSVTLDPSTATLAGLADGDSTPIFQLPASDLSASDGSYRIRLDPRAVPAAFVDDGGVVTFEILGLSDDGSTTWSTTTSARAVSTADGLAWADPIDSESAVQPGARAVRFPRYHGNVHTVRAARLTRIAHRTVTHHRGASVAEDTVGNCTGPNPRKTQVDKDLRMATIGTTYPLGDNTAWMEVDFSQGATYGIGTSGSGAYGSWTAAGTRKISGGWGFDWDPAKVARSYQVEVDYRKYHYEYLDSRCDHYTWEPLKETGGTGENKGLDRPDWTQCQPESAGKWYRNRSDGSDYTYGGAVKFADALGLDLSIDRGYSNSQRLAYQLTSSKRMCGNDDYPAYAGKVMERYS